MLPSLPPSRPPLWIFAHEARRWRRVRDAEYLMTARNARRTSVVVVYSDSRPRAMTEIMHDTIRDRPEGPLATLSINA